MLALPSLRDPQVVLPTIVSGLQVYFDKALGSNLLYRFERPQYADIRKRFVTGPTVQVNQEREMSSIYGAEHLLRMIGALFSYHPEQSRLLTTALVSLPAMVAGSTMDPESVGLVRDYVTELMTCVLFLFSWVGNLTLPLVICRIRERVCSRENTILRRCSIRTYLVHDPMSASNLFGVTPCSCWAACTNLLCMRFVCLFSFLSQLTSIDLWLRIWTQTIVRRSDYD